MCRFSPNPLQIQHHFFQKITLADPKWCYLRSNQMRREPGAWKTHGFSLTTVHKLLNGEDISNSLLIRYETAITNLCRLWLPSHLVQWQKNRNTGHKSTCKTLWKKKYEQLTTESEFESSVPSWPSILETVISGSSMFCGWNGSSPLWLIAWHRGG